MVSKTASRTWPSFSLSSRSIKTGKAVRWSSRRAVRTCAAALRRWSTPALAGGRSVLRPGPEPVLPGRGRAARPIHRGRSRAGPSTGRDVPRQDTLCSRQQSRQRLGAIAEAVDGNVRLLEHGQEQVGHRGLGPALVMLAGPQGSSPFADQDDGQVDMVVPVAVADAAAVEDQGIVEQRRPAGLLDRSSSSRSCRQESRYDNGRSRGACGSFRPCRRGARVRGGRR